LLTLQSRKKLIELARSYQFFIIEDSPYRLLRYEGNPIPSFFELEPELVIHMSSFSKLISPGLRVGYMLLPEGLSKQVAKVAEDTYINPSYFNQALVFEYCQEGFLEPQIDYLKNLYKQRRDIMMNALSQKMNGLAHWNKPQGGFFIGCHLIEKMSAENIMQTAITSGIKLTDGRAFYTEGGDTFIRLPRWPVPGRPQKIPVQILSSSALVFGAKTKYSVYGDSLCH
jgi:2-aminoadipate transaminase